MPAKSKAQQRFFGMVRAAQKGDMEAPSPEVSKAADSMSKSSVKKYAKTKHDKLPEKVKESMDLSNFYDILMDEEWKPFPHDKVKRQIEKKEKRGSEYDKDDAAKMRAVKAHKSATDAHKQRQKFTGSDAKKYSAETERLRDREDKAYTKAEKHSDKEDKAEAKGNKKKAAKQNKKFRRSYQHAANAQRKADGRDAVLKSWGNATKEEDEKQAAHNREVKKGRETAKKMMARAGLEAAHKKPAVKGSTKGGFKESMNFSEYLDSVEGVETIYRVEGELPKCPPGYKYNQKTKRCEPKTEKDSVMDKGSKDSSPANAASYKVWGRTGLNGDGYAWEDRGGNWGDGGNNGGGMGDATPY